ncbi:CDK5 regulatory subunit-associated protein 2-like isoform X2 [Periplaneta americana]|uniref:CDK5 regulatory subunit-associated protein 2-like isoform X2 n=1 Tax=Periplaneta americana TaxID=6978 RepID=UPI0037E774D3
MQVAEETTFSINMDDTTSPSQLQEVTLDPNASAIGTIPFTLGLRSPGKTSPIRGRTMKEYEEQLSQLKKENFNLKLRIYFLEERMGHMNGVDDKEDPVKKNIELKVETETLRKEVSDKQDLLCQAAKALDLIEEQHQGELKKIRQERDMEKEGMEMRIRELEHDLKDYEAKLKDPTFLKMDGSSALINEVFGLSAANTCANHHTHEEVEKLQQQIEELESQVQQLECSLQEETVRSNQLEADLQDAQQEAERVGIRCQGLELELKQRDSKLEDLVQELEQRGQDLAGCHLSIRTLEEALSAKEPEIQIKVQELCERDRIIEEKQSQIEQQNKVLVEIQITLDEKQRQIETLRSSLAARDSSIADLEGRLAKAKANARNLEAKLDASVHEANRLREEVETLKAQQKRINNRSREQMQQELDLLSPLRRRSSNLSSISDDKTSPGRRTRPVSEDDSTLRKRMLELKEKEEKLKILEESQQEVKTQLDAARQEAKNLEDKVKQLESGWKDAESKLQEAEKKIKDKEGKSKKLEEDHLKACQAIKSFMKRTKDMGREMEQLRSEVKKKDRNIRDLLSKMNELQDAYNKANWEARQLQAQARVQGGGGIPGAFEDVRDMTEEENERLWAEVEDKNKKLAQLTKERDNLSIEMEKQVQALISSLKEKEMLLEEYEKNALSSVSELEVRDNRIKELEEDLKQLRKELEILQVNECKAESKDVGEEKSAQIPDVKENKSDDLYTELEGKNREVERLNGELNKRNTNLQELVNKELWDKNREIERLQDHLTNICERKDLEIISLQHQIGARDYQLKLFQDKVAELGIHVNLPTSLMLRELQQIPVTFNQHVHFQQTSGSSGDSPRFEFVDSPRVESGTAVSSSTCTPKDEVMSLREQLQACIEERKYLCRKVEELRERLRNTPERDSDSRTLRSECVRLREEIDRANAWRKEAGEACTLLTKRLEELAGFLSSLLRHPERLNGLGAKRRQLLKQAVEHSMELSRSLSVSFFVNCQDLSNSGLPPLMDSFSSFISASDLNISLSDLLQEDEDEVEMSSCDPGQQDNIKSSGTSPYETTLTPNSQCCSGSNSEIAHIQGMKDSTTSEENYVLRDKMVGDQALVIAKLRSQVEMLTQGIKQRDLKISLSQKDGANVSAVLTGSRSGSSSPSKGSTASSGTIWKSRTETERLEDVKEAEESLSSMTFYNSQHPVDGVVQQWSNESQNILHNVTENSTETGAVMNSVSCQEKSTDVRRSKSSPIRISPTAAEQIGLRNGTVDTGRQSLKKQDHLKSTKSPLSYKMCRSSSASAVALSQLQQSAQHHDIAAGSLSESEAWSEPDRNVSLARIGLNEETAKAVLSPGNGVNGCTVMGTSRSRNGRIMQDEADTSESSEETAHEINRIQGKRSRSDAGEVRRLQNRLRALEQVNEALRAELAILHQLAPTQSVPPAAEVNKPLTRDMSINTTYVVSEEKLDKSTSVEKFQDKENGNNSSVTIPIHLLDQIRYQREKLESSLYHNDFIRRQLESIISSLSSSQGDDNMMSLWQKMKETAEQLEEARHQSQVLEMRLQEMAVQLEKRNEEARLASAANEQLQVTRRTVSILQEQVSNLEARLQEKDNEILERKCLLLEFENQSKQQSIEAEKMIQETKILKEDAEKQIKGAENMRCEGEKKLQEAQKLVIEAEKRKLEAEQKMEGMKKQFEEAEIQITALKLEKETMLKEKEIMQNDRDILEKEKNTIWMEQEELARERNILQMEKISLESQKEDMKKEMEESMNKIETIAINAKKQAEEAEIQMMEAKKKIQEAEVLKQEAESKLRIAEEKSVQLEKYKETVDLRVREMEAHVGQKLKDAEKKLEENELINKAAMEEKLREAQDLGQEFEAELRFQIEEAMRKEKEIRLEADLKIKNIEDKHKESEMELRKRLQDSERCCREKECELMKQIDQVSLTTSEAALERTRLANEKLRLEQEVRRHEAREAELIREKKDAENRLLVTKEQLEKEISILQQQKNDLEKCVKDLEAANHELRERIGALHLKDHPSPSSAGPDSTSSLTHMKIGRSSPGSYSSGLDMLPGEGGSLSNSPWGTAAAMSLEYNGSQSEDRDQGKDRSRRGSDGGRNGGLTALSSLVLQHGFGRQRSELSDYMSEDQALEEYGAVFTQTCSSSYWVTTRTEQHSTSSNSVPTDPSLIRNINSSPDLGIESDQGRFSSLEATSSGIPVDVAKMVSTMEGYASDVDTTNTAVVINSRGDTSVKSYKELEQENIVLRRRLTRTHRALEETLAQLTAANQRKKQVERAICKQLHKTHHILKKAKVNLDMRATDLVTPSTEEVE